MSIKSISIKALITSIAMSCSVSAMAEITSFKVAVIKNTTAAKAITSGDLKTSIEQLTSIDESSFETNTNLCVAYLKSKIIDKSMTACTAAIDSINSVETYDRKKSYLQSLSYSNRAISRYLNNDFSGAMSDLNVASSISSNPITAGNLKLMQNKMVAMVESADEILAD